jgi:hypothetical protein
MAMLATAGVLSYKAVIYFLSPKEEDAVVAFQNETVSVDTTKAGADGMIKNLIFCYNDDTKEINKIVLEILDEKNKQLTYLTIPTRTQFTMSAALYKRLVLDCPEIPQLLKLSAISKSFDFKKEFMNGTLIVRDLLRTEINYYTAIPQSKYDKIFTEKQVTQSDGSSLLPEEVYSGDYKEFLKTLDSSKKIKAYIKDIYPDLKSSISLKEKLKLIDSYSEITPDHITFDLIKGNNLNSAYVVDPTLAAEQLTGIK